MGPNEDREQRLHDAKMERLAREKAEKAKLLESCDRYARLYKECSEERDRLRFELNNLSEARHREELKCAEFAGERERLILQNQELQKNYDAMHKLWEIADREWRNAERLNQELQKEVDRFKELTSPDAKCSCGSRLADHKCPIKRNHDGTVDSLACGCPLCPPKSE